MDVQSVSALAARTVGDEDEDDDRRLHKDTVVAVEGSNKVSSVCYF